MASINGVALKAVKSFVAMEGIGFTSNVYIDNKKVGAAGDGGYGGNVEIAIEPKYREEFAKRVKVYFEKNPAIFSGDEWFINELYEMWENEKHFKKNSKKGFPILISMTYRKRNEESPLDRHFKPDVMVSVATESDIEYNLKNYEPVEYKVFRKLEDFNIKMTDS